jgi:mRNA-degrading endonuclease RelE of RelBE toxin-antitoxin system
VALTVAFTRRGEKEFLELALVDRNRIRERLLAYAAEPDHPRHDLRPVIGTDDVLRMRSGVWRVLFVREATRVSVQRVLHRREAYR